MSISTDFAKELEREERKHKRIVKYDLEIFSVLFVAGIFIIAASLSLRNSYKPLRDAKTALAPALTELNRSLLNVAETYRNNSVDAAARTKVDNEKKTFDAAILYFGTISREKESEGIILAAVDSCYRAAVRFRSVVASQKDLAETGIDAEKFTVLDRDLNRLRERRDVLLEGIRSYNNAGFFLKISSLTPYPGSIEHDPEPLASLQPISELTPPKPVPPAKGHRHHR